MSTTHRPTRPATLAAVLLGAVSVLFATAAPAAADTLKDGAATASTGVVVVGGTELVPELLPVLPEAVASASPEVPDSETSIDLPDNPLLGLGLLTAVARVHPAADVESQLEIAQHEIAGPYHAAAFSEIVDVRLLEFGDQLPVPLPTPAGSALIEVGAIRAEAVAVCREGQLEHEFNAELLDISVAGEQLTPGPLPIDQAVEEIAAAIAGTPLAALVSIEVGGSTPSANGVSGDALRIRVLNGELPGGETEIPVLGDVLATVFETLPGGDALPDLGGALLDVQLGHAEVSGLTCGPDAPAEPPADTPEEADDPAPVQQLPRTGSDDTATAALAGLMGAGALGLFALRRKITA